MECGAYLRTLCTRETRLQGQSRPRHGARRSRRTCRRNASKPTAQCVRNALKGNRKIKMRSRAPLDSRFLSFRDCASSLRFWSAGLILRASAQMCALVTEHPTLRSRWDAGQETPGPVRDPEASAGSAPPCPGLRPVARRARTRSPSSETI
jgi:hypothetical protein